MPIRVLCRLFRRAALAITVMTVFSSIANERVPDVAARVCGAEIIEAVAGELRLPTFDPALSSCRRDPVTSGTSIVAIVSPADDEHFNLDVAIWDVRARKVVAKRRDPAYLVSDASSLRATEVDTARYQLAADVRAFGVRDVHYPYNTHSKWSETRLTMFVRRGEAIDRIFSTQVELLTDGGSSPGCDDATRAVRSAITIAPTGGHGFKDLLVVTHDSVESGVPGKSCKAATIDRQRLTYDGATYGSFSAPGYSRF